MAFNPFAGFAKYRRFWMAVTLILVMVTFVLCSGSKGDMADIFMRTFQFGRTVMFRIDGKSYSREDFYRLQLQRKVANDYVTVYSRLVSDALQERLRQPGENKEAAEKENFVRMAQVQKLIAFRRQNVKFFEAPFPPEKGASKTDEIIDFATWLAEANRLGINLQSRTVQEMINADLMKMFVARDVDLYAIEQRALGEVLRNQGEKVNEDFVFKALENEYRVRIAQLADVAFQLRTVSGQLSPIKRVSSRLDTRAEYARLPLSPGNLWDYFQANRKVFDVALMPIPVAEFVSDVPEPDERKLQELYEKGKRTAFDPASPQPGFQKAQQVKVQYVSVDQNSPFYKTVTRTADALVQCPIGSFVPQLPLATALTFAAAPTMYDSMLAQDYYSKVRTQQFARIEFLGGSVLSTDPTQATLAYLSRKDPISIASLVGAAARADSMFPESAVSSAIPAFLVRSATEKKDVLQASLKADVKTLAPVFATIVASGTMPNGYASIAEILHYKPYLYVNDLSVTPTLPFAVVRSEMQRDFNLRLATRLAMANMAYFKKEFDATNRTGDPKHDAPQVKRLLERYGPLKEGQTRAKGFRDLGLEVAQTDKFYDRYTIKDAPELKPLLEAYQTYYGVVNQAEGRDMFGKGQKTDRVRGEPLKDDDFWRIFFDAESFATQKPYEAKPWPPIIKLGTPEQIDLMMEFAQQHGEQLPPANYREMKRQAEAAEANKDVAFNLFATAERPFLFWKTEEKIAATPTSLDEVKDRVVQAAKMQAARDTKALPYAKKVAEDLIVGKAAYKQAMALQKFGKDIVVFERLAPIYRDMPGRPYGDFKLGRDSVRYPREDMVSQMLSLVDLKEPIKVSVAEKPETVFTALDTVNDELFKFGVKNERRKDRHVQILTNKPRDTLYLAVVDVYHGPNSNEFYYDILPGAGQFQNMFFDRALDKLGEDHYRALVRQLRDDHRVKVEEEAKKGDNDGGGQ